MLWGGDFAGLKVHIFRRDARNGIVVLEQWDLKTSKEVSHDGGILPLGNTELDGLIREWINVSVSVPAQAALLFHHSHGSVQIFRFDRGIGADGPSADDAYIDRECALWRYISITWRESCSCSCPANECEGGDAAEHLPAATHVVSERLSG